MVCRSDTLLWLKFGCNLVLVSSQVEHEARKRERRNGVIFIHMLYNSSFRILEIGTEPKHEPFVSLLSLPPSTIYCWIFLRVLPDCCSRSRVAETAALACQLPSWTAAAHPGPGWLLMRHLTYVDSTKAKRKKKIKLGDRCGCIACWPYCVVEMISNMPPAAFRDIG